MVDDLEGSFLLANYLGVRFDRLVGHYKAPTPLVVCRRRYPGAKCNYKNTGKEVGIMTVEETTLDMMKEMLGYSDEDFIKWREIPRNIRVAEQMPDG